MRNVGKGSGIVMLLLFCVGCVNQKYMSFIDKGIVTKTVDARSDFFNGQYTIVHFEMNGKSYEAISRLFSKGDTVSVHRGLGDTYYLR